jgi:uncharacterized protein DUF6221
MEQISKRLMSWASILEDNTRGQADRPGDGGRRGSGGGRDGVAAVRQREGGLSMTEPQTLTLAEFLLARIAEDREWARGEFRRQPGWCAVLDGRRAPDPPNSPARAMAGCEATRRIVALHAPDAPGAPGTSYEDCVTCADDGHIEENSDGHRSEYRSALSYPCPTLRALAAPYADHPDYRDEWRP